MIAFVARDGRTRGWKTDGKDCGCPPRCEVDIINYEMKAAIMLQVLGVSKLNNQ